MSTGKMTQLRKQVINITNKTLAQIKLPCKRRANKYPLNSNCLPSYIIYQTTVDTVDDEEKLRILETVTLRTKTLFTDSNYAVKSTAYF